MKRVSCPKCGAYITFDEKAYPVGRILVFGCPACNKQFRVRCKAADEDEEEQPQAYGRLIVVGNTFHDQQELPLTMGENVIGRYVKGTNANRPITTSDPSIDTTHCIVTVKNDKKGRLRFILRDAPSNTGTFYQDTILRDSDRVYIDEGDVITIGATSMIFERINTDEDEQ